MCVCVYVCACVRFCLCVGARLCGRAWACLRACLCLCVCACVRVCVLRFGGLLKTWKFWTPENNWEHRFNRWVTTHNLMRNCAGLGHTTILNACLTSCLITLQVYLLEVARVHTLLKIKTGTDETGSICFALVLLCAGPCKF